MLFSFPILCIFFVTDSFVQNMQGLFCNSHGVYMQENLYVIAANDEFFHRIICSTPMAKMPSSDQINRWVANYNDNYPHDKKQAADFAVYSCPNTDKNREFAHNCYWHPTAHNMTKPLAGIATPEWTFEYRNA